MEIEPCTKTEALMLRKFGHVVFAALDADMKPVRYFIDTANAPTARKGMPGRRRQKNPRVYADAKLNLVDRDYVFTRPDSMQSHAYDLLLKKFQKPNSVMTREKVEEYIAVALDIDVLAATSVMSVFLHKLGILKVKE